MKIVCFEASEGYEYMMNNVAKYTCATASLSKKKPKNMDQT